MKCFRTIAVSIAAAAALAGCTSTPSAGPIQVTRFHEAAGLNAIGQGSVFVDSAPSIDGGTLADAPYKAAVARQLAQLGYVEADRASADLIAQVKVERYTTGTDLPKRGPVSVGVGGSTGSYGSGVGLGIGINLGGKKNRENLGTELAVMLRDKASGKAVWEGRAEMEVARGSELAAEGAAASILADALFRDFPGGNGETVEVEVSQ